MIVLCIEEQGEIFWCQCATLSNANCQMLWCTTFLICNIFNGKFFLILKYQPGIGIGLNLQNDRVTRIKYPQKYHNSEFGSNQSTKAYMTKARPLEARPSDIWIVCSLLFVVVAMILLQQTLQHFHEL